MNRARNVVLLALLCLPTVAVQAQEWSGPAAMALEVKGKPKGNVEGALVILRYQQMEPPAGPRPVLTDSAGRAVLVDLAPGVWEVEVSHDDFLSFVALVLLDGGRKPTVQASFLQASGSSLTPIRVKFMDGKGKSPSPSVPLPPEAAARLAQRRPPPPPPSPAAAPTTPRARTRVPRAPQPVIPEPELRPLPETARRTGQPTAPPLTEPPAPEPVPPTEPEPSVPEAAAVAEPESTPPAPELEPAPQPPAPPIEQAPPAPAPAPVPAESEPQPPAPEPQPEVAQPTPAPAPASPSPPPLPEPAPEPAMPERSTLPEPEPMPVEPEPTPAPPIPEPAAPAEPAPTMPEPSPAPQPEPTPPAPAPQPTPPAPAPQPAPAKPAPTPTREPKPAPAEPAPAPTPERPPEEAAPMPEPVADQPPAEPQPIEPPAVASVLAAPGSLGPTLRAYRDRTCVECRPGEWAISIEAVAGAAGRPCADTLEADGRELSTLLGGSIALELKEVAAPAPEALARMGSADPTARVAELLGDDSSACRIVAAVIPKAGRFRGLRMEAADASGVGDCQADRPCPVGRAYWIGQPRVSREPSSNVIWGLFVNEAPDRARRARLTVYFAAPYRAWDPTR